MAFPGKFLRNRSVKASKLALDAFNGLLKADGSVPLSGPLNAGNNKISGVARGDQPTDAATLADLQNIIWKDQVYVATTGPITLSGLQTIDSEAVSAGKRVLAKDNGPTAGIYVAAVGAWLRSSDANTAQKLLGAFIPVDRGGVNGKHRFVQNGDPITTLDTTPIVFVDAGEVAPPTYPTKANKGMAALLTTADYQLACATPITFTPAGDSYVGVCVDKMFVDLGDGARDKDCYFSNDGGATARLIANITSGDHLYWVMSIAQYPLDGSDQIDLHYNV